MGKKITYSCNLCNYTFTKDLKELKAFYWDSTIKNEAGSFGWYRLSTQIDSSGTHICDKCIDVIKKYN